MQDSKDISIEIKKLIHPNIELIINSATLKTRQQYPTGKFYRKGKNIVYNKPSE